MAEQQTITIEVDGKKLEARPGQMLIEVTDAAGISIPRFCYHKKLSIAANCRMCLVEVENAPKPLPACATPVNDGMKVWTCSPLAREAQKGTMEFLLINHPLDCPICDQGGECELQDLSMGYGRGVSRFVEGKRAVADKDIGPLVATEMTRCIHCTRCVRFGEEIAGLRELGAVGRGEHTEIGTYVERSMTSELSGNVIDLCPVGALTSKPFRFRARAWEMNQHDGIAWHDGVGSNIHLHTRRGQLLRVVPRENEAVNETWISDRDRFSYQGLYSDDRLLKPMMRVNGELREVEWQEALIEAAKALKEASAEGLGALVSPSATLEEMHLVRRLVNGLGSASIDHRLRLGDFRARLEKPWLGLKFAELEQVDAALLVGSWLRKEQPLLNHRLRKAALAGSPVMALNPVDFLFNFDLAEKILCTPSRMVAELAGVAAALGADTAGVQAEAGAAHQSVAERLKAADKPLVLLGNLGWMHPDFSLLLQLAHNIAGAVGGRLALTGEGANSTGAALAGLLPGEGGRDFNQMREQGMETLLLFNLEPEFDTAHPAATAALLQGARVIAMATHKSPWLEEHADFLFPVAAVPETSGTFANLQGDIQSFRGVVPPAGEARPGWKVLRVLGNLTDLKGFEYESSEEVREELLKAAGEPAFDNGAFSRANGGSRLEPAALERIGGVPIHNLDAIVRRAPALQQTADAWCSAFSVHPDTTVALGLGEGDSAVLRQGEGNLTLPVMLDVRVAPGCVWLPTGVPGSELLGEGFGAVTLEKA